MTQCSIEGCDGTHKARGLCGVHYQRFLKHGDPQIVKAQRGVRGIANCSVADCPNKAFSKGMCNKHHLRWHKHGDPNIVISVQDKRPAAERWRDRYQVHPETGCWLWSESWLVHGYGKISDQGVDKYAYRYVYEQLVGPIPVGMTLDHLCHSRDASCAGGDTCWHRRCVNPEHMQPVPLAVNIARGQAPPSVNRRKVECKWGHEFTPENTYIRTDGRSRGCRACTRRAQREYRARKKLAQ